MRNLFLQIAIICFLSISYSVLGQNGGKNTYEFLDLPNAARVASLGGNVISIQDNDLNLVFHNPSLLNKEMSENFVLNYINYFSDINFGYVSYAKHIEKYGTFAAGLHYINYGKFTEADYTGQIMGEFTAAEYALNIMYARPLDSNFTVGANLKSIYSALDTYYSSGMAIDVGVTYHNSKNLTAALVIKNFGHQIKPYYEGNWEPLPFDIQIGVSKRLGHAPFRFSVLAQNLTNFKMRYELPENNDITQFDNDSIVKEHKIEKFADEVARHFIFAAEFIPVENFYLRFGYNYQRRKELQLVTRAKLTGFSFGIGVRVSKFHFSYGLATYHVAGASHHFSISTDLSEFYKKN